MQATLLLLSAATKCDNYNYLHLLSGQCFPIKSQKQIHSFFESKSDQFVAVNDFTQHEKTIKYRVNFIHLGLELGDYRNNFFLKILRKFVLLVQYPFNFFTGKKESFHYGSQWFSITNDFAKHLVDNKQSLLKKYRWALCPDEIFVQTELMNNIESYSKAEKGNYRYIDWAGCKNSPRTLVMNDYESLIASDALFARKFDQNIDSEIIIYFSKILSDCK